MKKYGALSVAPAASTRELLLTAQRYIIICCETEPRTFFSLRVKVKDTGQYRLMRYK